MGIVPDWNGADPWFEDLRRPKLKVGSA